ncbi:aminopeptidase [Treponema sp.]|uniref:aminopeptidase n=1 Tax=Treponema sp. TaxID=166 RepID=UPI00257AAE59|nr:aminopeptidase [Treponema sp.]MBE6353237.1 peptidase M17 [Treponema sp.]
MSIFSPKEKTPAQTVVEDVCKIKKGETVLIIANPETNLIAQDLYTAACESGAKPTLIFQQKKSSMDAAEKAVVGAIKSEPDVCFSISAVKLGKDKEAQANPYKTEDGKSYDSTFDYLMDGKKTMRAVWTPGLTQDMFNRTVQIDYKLLAERCKKICEKYKNAVSVHVTAPGGTDVIINVEGRQGLTDDGDFSKPGTGGNIPAGEVFISPVVGKTHGRIVYDGSMTFSDGDSILETPIDVRIENGYITDISGGEEAKRLLKDITAAEKAAIEMESKGTLPKGQGEFYAKNARGIGELGIGLNPNATITGNMLEDEKAFRTCHFAIGENYDGDGNALIHFDGVVRNPTIVISYSDKTEFTVLKNGELQI